MSFGGKSTIGAIVGVVFSAPVVLVPGSAILMMVWARWTFYQRHPDYVQNSAPTISRAISDPYIGEPFGLVILAVAVIVALAMIPLCAAYFATIDRRTLGNPAMRRKLRRLMRVFIVLQALGTTGMVVCTQVTFRNGHDLHMIGSYLFFVFQALSILLSGVIATRLVRLPGGPFGRYLPLDTPFARVRRYMAFGTAGLAVLYMILFVVKGWDLPVSEYDIYNFYTIHEIVTISAYIFHFMLYAPEIYVMARNLASLGVWRDDPGSPAYAAQAS